MTGTRVGRWASALVLALVALLVAALTAPTAGALGLTSDAAAQSSRQALAGDANPALIPPDATGTLTIHASLGPGLDQTAYPPNGTALTLPETNVPLPGAVFTITRVEGVDLTTSAGWEAAARYLATANKASLPLGAVRTSAPTGADGTTVVSGLPVGLYLVHESSVRLPDGTLDATIVTIADFLVTIPMTDPVTRDRWMFTVHVYPKNVRPHPTAPPPSVPTTSVAPSQPSGPLAVTGAEIAGTLMAAGILLVGGITLAIIGGRRSRKGKRT